jgi:hypothetical protein
MGASTRAEVETTIEGGAGREYIEIGRQRGGGEDNMDSGPVALNSKEKENERTETKEERGEHTSM